MLARDGGGEYREAVEAKDEYSWGDLKPFWIGGFSVSNIGTAFETGFGRVMYQNMRRPCRFKWWAMNADVAVRSVA